MAEMTHERCSELLRAYVAGDLPRDEDEAVRSHLDGCPDCRAEEGALLALTAAEEPLDDIERARLHRALARELFPEPANRDVATPPDARWKRWVAPALGSAAAVLVALLVITGGGLSGSDDEGAAQSGGGELESSEAAIGANDGGGGGKGANGPGRTKDHSVSVASGSSAYDGDGPEPQFHAGAGELSAEELSEIGRTSDLFLNFSDRYSVDDVSSLRPEFLRRLASAAGPDSDQVRDCAATLPDDEPILPAYGATGTYDDRDALVLGFVTNDAGSSSLDRYLMWVWTKGECSQPIDTLFERIED
jgi:hypothetical protein